MTKRQWNDLFTLAREIEASIAVYATLDADKARRLARTVLALNRNVREKDGVQPRR